MKGFLFVFALAMFCSSCTSYFYVVRHADRLNASDDSPLSADGFTRAKALRDTLIGKGIDSLFASQYLRTEQTADPLAKSLNKTIYRYQTAATNGFITRLKRIKGKSVLVVGHSDNVPAIVQGLSLRTVPAIAANDFDNLYVIKVRKFLWTTRQLWHKTYGVPSP